jgi:hypothetical protein
VAKVGNLEEHVHSRLVTVCHVWPGITPLNVWDLTFEVWLMFAHAADEWVEARKEANRGR